MKMILRNTAWAILREVVRDILRDICASPRDVIVYSTLDKVAESIGETERARQFLP